MSRFIAIIFLVSLLPFIASCDNPFDKDSSSSDGDSGTTVSATGCHKAPSTFICDIEKAIIDKTNAHRATQTLPNLQHDAILSFTSRDWSQKQAAANKISHDGFPHDRTTVYTAELGSVPSINISGENVAFSTISSSATAEQIAETFFQLWVNSSGHKANMEGNFKWIGVGVFQDGNKYYATQLFAVDK